MTLRSLLGFALGVLVAFPLAVDASPNQRDPYVDVAGDAMTGDLVLVGPAGVAFDAGTLTGAANGTLSWNGAPVCIADAACSPFTPGHGLTLDGDALSVDTSVVQARVAACAPGWSIRAVAQDGSVTCQPDVDTDTDTLASLGCAPGDVPKLAADAAWTCASDELAALAAGDGLDLAGDELSVDASVQRRSVAPACPAGHFITALAADGTPTCGADAVGETSSAALVADNSTPIACSFSGGFFHCDLREIDIGSKTACTAVGNVTFAAPSAGVVLLDADVRIRHEHEEGRLDATRLSLGTCFFPDGHTATVETARALPTDDYLSNAHVSRVVPATEGTRTFTLNVQTVSGGSPDDRIVSANLRAVFVPT